MNNKCGKYAGMDRYEARKAMVEDLEKLGLLVKVVDHVHNVGTHDRCKTTVEPMIKPQWFVKMADMLPLPAKREERGSKLHPGSFQQDLSELAEQYPRLVYFPSALVGSSYPGLYL